MTGMSKWDEEAELQLAVRRNKQEIQMARLEVVRFRAIALWSGALTAATVLLILSIVFWTETLFLLTLPMVIPAIAGGIIHANYYDRINALQKEMK